MRLRRLSTSVLSLSLLALGCNDSNPTYPAIIIYGNQDSPGSGNTGNTGSGNTGNTGNTGSGNTSNTGSGNTGNTSTGNNGNNGSGDTGNTGSGGANSSGGAGNNLFAHCNELWSGQDPPVEKVQCDLDALTDGGELKGDLTADKTLKSGNAYRIKGTLRVMPGVTLTVEPCVKVIGESSEALLAVLSGGNGDPNGGCVINGGAPVPGGKLVAVGEPMAPIVFTSAKPKGQRAPGDWGGVILMGKALNNGASPSEGGSQVPIEGLARPECHGWYTHEFDKESSGKLQYVRIEYASRQIRADSETNGLTLASLGSGTEMHYVMVSNSADDCFEWFGGTANADHLIALNCEDDMFDGDQGFSGKLQFLFGRQYPTTTEVDSRGFEIDGAAGPLESVGLPYTTEQVSNFTICGGGAADKNGSRDGAVLRKFAQNVGLENGLITGFAGSAIFVQADTSPAASMTYVQEFDNAHGIAATADVSNNNSGVMASWFLNQAGNSVAEPDRFCDCWANPPVPVAASAAKGGKPSGFPDETADYVGALPGPSADTNWMRGAWVDWSAE